MNRDDAVRKIRALLNREGRTDAECDTAQVLAAAIADKAGLDLAEVDLSDPARPPLLLVHREIGKWAKRPPEAFYASLIVQRFFDITPLNVLSWTGETTYLIGFPHHIDIGEYIFEFLIAEFRRAWNRRKSRTKARRQFIYGVFCALHTKLDEQRTADSGPEGGRALAVSWKAARSRYIDEHFGETTTKSAEPPCRRSVATRAGWVAGRDIEIRPALDGDDASPQGSLCGAPGGRRLALPEAL